VESSPLPEDVDQDEIDEAVRRIRGRMEDAVVLADLKGVAVRVRTEIREGRVWIVGDLTRDKPDPPS
jgi:hypothetical protein